MILQKLRRMIKLIITSGVLYLMAVMPRVVNRPDTGLFKKKYFAHRGLHDNAGDAPENSMAAFRRAVEAGYGMELDVQMTRDGVPVIFHDSKLERMCGVGGEIGDYTYEELKQFTLADSRERIPRLEDLLLMVGGRVPLIVEIKTDKADVSCCEVIDKALRTYGGEYCIESFNPLVLFWFRRHHNEVVRGQLSTNFRRDGESKVVFSVALTHLLCNFVGRPDFIAYNKEFMKDPGRKICRKLFKSPAAAWTVRSFEELEKARGEFDLFIFESFMP